MNTNRKAQSRNAEKRQVEQRETTRQSNRVPLGNYRRKLSIDDNLKSRIEQDGYVLRWVNDQKSRIHDAQQAGYVFVTSDGLEKIGDNGDQNTDPGSRISQIVGTNEVGDPIRAYLMAIPRDFYEEDQQLKQKQVDEIDDAIKGGNVAPGEKQYVPKGGISYQP